MTGTSILWLALTLGTFSPATGQQHLRLDAGSLRTTFDPANQGNIVSLGSEGIEVVSKPQEALLFKIGLVRGGRVRYYSNQDFEKVEAWWKSNWNHSSWRSSSGNELITYPQKIHPNFG